MGAVAMTAVAMKAAAATENCILKDLRVGEKRVSFR
jgi:hypothetical protein